jgi:hypothetical protein
MGTINPTTRVKFFSGVIASSLEDMGQAAKLLEEEFGRIDSKSGVIDFDFTDYYAKEMGKPLLRQWVSFEKPIDPGDLAGIKVRTNELEQRFVSNGKRKVNLDPGYLAQSKLVLASTKDFSHRIYLSDGIYAEITMLYKGKEFKRLEWTYPDYASDFAKGYFTKVRNIYSSQLP